MQYAPRPTSISINLAPMVDVTMCLMIFFMLTTEMVKNENSAAIDLPLAAAAKAVEKKDLGDRFVINIRDARLTGGDGATYIIGEEELSLAGLLDRLEAESRERSEVNCVIRADRELPYRYVQAVMLGCSRSGVRKVTFSAVPRAGDGQ